MIKREVYLERAYQTYHQQFVSPENADDWVVNAGKTYLIEHGLRKGSRADKNIVDKYWLGVVINPLSGDERFENSMAIPYMTQLGCKAIRFRLLKDDKPKMAQTKGQPIRLYNPGACFSGGDIIGICEGEIDAIVATEKLGIPSVGLPGSKTWTHSHNIWAPLFKNFERVIVFPDGDEDGRNLADEIAETLKLKVQILTMPNGMDVSKMVASGRKNELLRQLADDEK